MIDFDVPFGTYVHVCGTDIVRDETAAVVLDDAPPPA